MVSSSLLAAWAVHAADHERRGTALRCLAGTLVLGLAFLCVKAVEYAGHFAHGIYPGAHYRAHELPGDALGTLALLVARRKELAGYAPLELGVLYWHLVDVIWIFLWPLLYLAG